jgi:hypothetical protein
MAILPSTAVLHAALSARFDGLSPRFEATEPTDWMLLGYSSPTRTAFEANVD